MDVVSAGNKSGREAFGKSGGTVNVGRESVCTDQNPERTSVGG